MPGRRIRKYPIIFTLRQLEDAYVATIADLGILALRHSHYFVKSLEGGVSNVTDVMSYGVQFRYSKTVEENIPSKDNYCSREHIYLKYL